jgi:SAM-dependent methyltransferase
VVGLCSEKSLFDFGRHAHVDQWQVNCSCLSILNFGLQASSMTFADSKQRFSNRVADYVRYRPGYPAALLDLLRAECAFGPNLVVADVGSGTGLLSKLFLTNGNRVHGVEPNEEMREAGEEFLQEHKNFASVNGSAEATTLDAASVDFITVGQAFHWFDPAAARREFLRILKPGGWVVITWNDRRMVEAQLTREYEDLLERFGIDYKRVKDAYPESDDIRSFFAAGGFSARDLPNQQILDWEGFRGRLRSSSFAPTEDHPNYAPMMAELERIFHAHERNGSVYMEYFTRVYFGQLRGDGN